MTVQNTPCVFDSGKETEDNHLLPLLMSSYVIPNITI